MLSLVILLATGALSCCDNILISDLNGLTQVNGQYRTTGQSLNARPIYEQLNGRYYLYFVRSTIYSDGWYISSTIGEVLSVMYTEDTGDCPDDSTQW